jgi:hypothetical protein
MQMHSYAKEEWLMMRAELHELKGDVVWSRFALAVIGAVVVVIGTLIPYQQLVYAQTKLPIWVQNQSDWSGHPLLSLAHDPGFVIAIVAVFTVVFEARAQWSFREAQRGFDEWNPGSLGLGFMSVIVMTLLVLFSWPLRGQGFAQTSQGVLLQGQGVGSAHDIVAQLVVLRGPGAVVSFVGIALLFYAIALQAVALWRTRPRVQTGEGVRTVAATSDVLNT